jgi:hypothetical protein
MLTQGATISTRAARYLALLIVALLPIPVHAQRPVLFTVTVTASIKVYRGPSVERRVVGYLEPGMPVSVFACREDSVWLDIGPSVWIKRRQFHNSYLLNLWCR